jgi:hypothetical protein
VYGTSPYYGVLGVASAATGYNAGVRGESDSTAGWGVAGIANATSGIVYGVGGVSASPDGRAVYGSNSATTGNGYAVYGVNSSTAGRALYGLAGATNGTTFGVYGSAASTNGRGVYGYATATSGPTYGVYGYVASTGGRGVTGISPYIGVQGQSDATTGIAYGVYGQGTSPSGYGVYGENNATAGDAYGVYGESNSTTGRGVYGLASGYGPGYTNYGVYGESVSPDGYGVYGLASATGGITHGVHGKSMTTGGSGVGVYGEGGTGVYGTTTATNGWAGYFITFSGNGVSVSSPSGKVGLDVAGGTKSAVVAADDGARLLYTEESTEVWFTDYGFGQLQDGAATIAIDPLFAQTVNLEEPYHVYVTSLSDQPVVLYVTERTATFFAVHGVMMDGRPASGTFDYRVVAKRLGYEDDRLERAPWADDDPNLYPEKRAELEARMGLGGER